MFKTPHSKKGFTLLELIVVIVILGILAALAIPSFSNVKTKAAEKTAISSAEGIVRDARAIAAFDGASLSDFYVDRAGSETAGYSASSNSLTVTSSGNTAVATIDPLTGEVSISGVSTPSGPSVVFQSLNAQPATPSLLAIGYGFNQSWNDGLSPSMTLPLSGGVQYDAGTKTVTWTAPVVSYATNASNMGYSVWDAQGVGYTLWPNQSSPAFTVTDNGNATATVSIDIDLLNAAWTTPVGLTFVAIQGIGPGTMTHYPFSFN